MTNKDIEDAFASAHKFGLHTSAFVMIGLPGEERIDVEETIRLLAKVQPGRFRWTLFFPFVGTKAYHIAEEEGAIDFERMAKLDNFTDETCMDLGDEVNLFVGKAKETFCALVNGYSGIPEYERIASGIDGCDEAAWRLSKGRIEAEIARVDARMAETGQRHYRVRYNRFMGVRSDWEDDSTSA